MAGVPSSLELFRSIRRRLLRRSDNGPTVRERVSLKWKSVGTPSGMFTEFVEPIIPVQFTFNTALVVGQMDTIGGQISVLPVPRTNSWTDYPSPQTGTLRVTPGTYSESYTIPQGFSTGIDVYSWTLPLSTQTVTTSVTGGTQNVHYTITTQALESGTQLRTRITYLSAGSYTVGVSVTNSAPIPNGTITYNTQPLTYTGEVLTYNP